MKKKDKWNEISKMFKEAINKRQILMGYICPECGKTFIDHKKAWRHFYPNK